MQLWNVQNVLFITGLNGTSQNTLTSLHCIEQHISLSPILYVSVNEQAVHLWMDVFNGNLKAIETSGLCHLNFSTEPLNLYVDEIEASIEAHCNHSHRVERLWFRGEHTRFSLTIPSLAAKNASTFLRKYLSSSLSDSQSAMSFDRSTSSAVQKEAVE